MSLLLFYLQVASMQIGTQLYISDVFLGIGLSFIDFNFASRHVLNLFSNLGMLGNIY